MVDANPIFSINDPQRESQRGDRQEPLSWSTAIVADAGSSTFLNYNMRTRIAPGIEFNLFPYSESTRQILAVQYTVGFNNMDYIEQTIFGKLNEQLADHQLIVSLTMRQPWGSGLAEVSVAQFVQDSDKYNIGAFGKR